MKRKWFVFVFVLLSVGLFEMDLLMFKKQKNIKLGYLFLLGSFLTALILIPLWLTQAPSPTNTKPDAIVITDASLKKTIINSVLKADKPSKKEIIKLIDTIKHASFDLPTQKNTYEDCQKFSDVVADANIPSHDSYGLLLKCRILANRYGISEERIAKWVALGKILKEKGWQHFLELIYRGDISIDASLQDGEPRHNLHVLFLMHEISNVSAYKALIEAGLPLNSKALGMAIIRNIEGFVDLYIASDKFYSVDDMQRNPVMQAVESGSLPYMQTFIDKGVSYENILGIDPLELYLASFVRTATKASLSEFIYKNNIAITNNHVLAAQRGQASQAILEFLQQQKEN